MLGPRRQQPLGALAQRLPAQAQLHPLLLQLRQQLQLSLLLLRQLLLLHLALGQGVLPLLDMQLQEALLGHQTLQYPLGGRLLMSPRMAGGAAQRTGFALRQLGPVLLQTLTGMGLLQLASRQRQLLAQPLQLR